MVKIKSLILFILFIGLVLPSVGLAEEDRVTDLSIGNPNVEDTGVDCFDYYEFGSVDIDLTSERVDYSGGEVVELEGSLKNQNSYPVTNGSLHVQVFRNNDDYEERFGNDLIDEFVAEDNVTINADSSTSAEFSWEVPEGLSSGEYFFVTDFVVDDQLYLSGANVLEGVYGAINYFNVESEEIDQVVFDKEAITVGGREYAARDFPPVLDEDDQVNVSYNVENLSPGQVDTNVEERLYSWDDLKEENLLQEDDYNLSLPVEGVENRQSDLGNLEPGTYLFVAEAEDYPAKLKVRFSVEGESIPTRVNYHSLENFPIQEGETGSVFACFHATAYSSAEGQEVVVTLTDDQGDEIVSLNYEGRITPGMMAIREEFTADRDLDSVSSETVIYDEDGEVVDSSTVDYNPDNFTDPHEVDVKIVDNEITVSPLNVFGEKVEAEMAIEVKDSQEEAVFFESSFLGTEFSQELNLEDEEDYTATVLISDQDIREEFDVDEIADEDIEDEEDFDEEVDPMTILAIIVVLIILAAILRGVTSLLNKGRK